MQGYDICLFEDIVDGCPFERERNGGGAGSGICQNLHFECGAEFGGALANATESDDTHGFSGEFGEIWIFPETEILTVLPYAFVRPNTVLRGFFEKVQNHGKNEFGNRIGAVDGDVGNGDVVLGRVSGVDNIVSGREDGYEFELGQLGKGFRAKRAFVGQDDLGILGALDNLVGACPRINREVTQGFDFSPRVVPGVEGVAIKNGDFHVI